MASTYPGQSDVTVRDNSTVRVIRRFSSIKVDFEKEKRKTLSRYQQQGLRVSMTAPRFCHDKKEIRKRLRVSVERYSLPELYVKMICGLFPDVNSRENPDSNALIQHMKHVFRLNDLEHVQLIEIAKSTKLPQRIINLEIVKAKDLPAKDLNGLSDPYCVVFVNSRDVAQRTKVVPNTLEPVWKQYFTFKVTESSRDVLVLEVMDYNEDEEPLRNRFRKFKEFKTPSTLGILFREIANARSVQELIGTIRIPVSEISSETIEKWFKLKNHEGRGELYLRMALGYNKSKEAATEEFLQIVHFLLVHELDKDTSLGTPFYWDEHYEMWSKYILRQFKWQGGLKPKDIVLAKWRAYTIINEIFPLNANMMCLLMDAVLDRVIKCEYDTREISRFWGCTEQLLTTIVTFLTELHEVLPCPVTVLHTYHMLKTIERLNLFLSQPRLPAHGAIPFNDVIIIDRVVKAVRDGANKFYIKVFSDSTFDNISAGQDPLFVALERLIKMGQILHEDVRLGVTTIDADFKGILNIDYLRITYQVYDEQYGKMVKFIVEEYSGKLLDPIDQESETDDAMDENSPSVKSALAVFKLYMAVKNLAEQAPADYLDDNLSEFSLKRGFHNWFFHSVATWIGTLRNRIIKWVKNSINLSEGNRTLSSESAESNWSKPDKNENKDLPISSSAIDTPQMFLEIRTFWLNLGWQCPQQSYLIVRKILEELYGYLVYYAAELLEALFRHEPVFEAKIDYIHQYIYKACTAINNINFVKEQVCGIGNQLNISDIIQRLKDMKTKGSFEYESEIEKIKNEMEKQVEGVIEKITNSVVKTMLPTFKKLLQDISVEILTKSSPQQKRFSVNRFRHLMDFVDNCFRTISANLVYVDFNRILGEFWMATVDRIECHVRVGLENGKSPDYFQRFNDLIHHLLLLFWSENTEEQQRVENPHLFEKYDELKAKLSDLELPLMELKYQYYEARLLRQQMTPVNCRQHGLITIRVGMLDDKSAIVLEVLNARNLKAYDSNNLSDPYASVSLAPKEYFPETPSFMSHTHKGTLFPLFEEKFTIPLNNENTSKGFLMIDLKDYNFIGRDDFMGEVFLSLSDLTLLESAKNLEETPQIHLVITKPNDTDDEILLKFEERGWDKEAVRFAVTEKAKK